MTKLRVGLLFGGRSVEHEVSIASASSILKALDPARYEVRLIGVDREGRWHLGSPELPPEASIDGEIVNLPVAEGAQGLVSAESGEIATAGQVDVIFPIVHGRGGEDGALQGLLELAEVPYVGSGVMSSAMQMDKDIAKRLLSAAGLSVTPWITFGGFELDQRGLPAAAERAEADLGFPVFVKPANSGSSIGIARAESIPELIAALADAQRYDRKVIVETAIDAREIEVAVLGNDTPEASIPGEIRAAKAFYDYNAKYADESTELIIPADLDASQSEAIRATAIRAYQTLEAEGMARVDFLIDRETGQFYVNELNSLPGFTSVSMYPKLWEGTGLAYPALLDRLIELALERHDRRSKLETHPPPPTT